MTDPSPTHDELPLPDYDHLATGSLAGHIRGLDAGQLGTVLAYERAHADRLAVVQLLENRLAELRAGAEPSGGAPDAARPEAAPGPVAAEKAGPATEGPKINPPSQGVPTNPAQPRT